MQLYLQKEFHSIYAPTLDIVACHTISKTSYCISLTDAHNITALYLGSNGSAAMVACSDRMYEYLFTSKTDSFIEEHEHPFRQTTILKTFILLFI